MCMGGGGRTGGEKERFDMSFYLILTPQEVLTGARLLKRMTFAIFSGEKDQYVSYLPDIQRKPQFYLLCQFLSTCSVWWRGLAHDG